MSSLSFHGWFVGLKKGYETDSINPNQEATYKYDDPQATVMNMTRGTDFEGEPNIETEEWEANTGQSTTLIANDRTSASSEPTWEQKAVFGEFFEEACYMLLGKKTTSSAITVTPSSGSTFSAYQWTFDKGEHGLPLATIKNSYFETGGDSMDYNNAKMSTWEMKFDDKGVNMTYGFSSDVVRPNCTNPSASSWSVPSNMSKLGTQDFKVYIQDWGSATPLFNTSTHTITATVDPYSCVTEGSIKFDNNLDDFICMGSDYGRSYKDEGEFKGEGELEVKWNSSSKPLIGKWITGSATSSTPTSDSCFAEVLIVAKGKKLGTYTPSGSSTTADFYEQFILYMPKVEITKAWSDLSGNDTKTISIEYETVASNASPAHIEIQSTYAQLSNQPFVSENS